MSNSLVASFIDAVSSGKIDDILKNISMPNIPFPTINAGFFWNDLAECNGWKLQKNSFAQHCRILDPDNVRRALGGDNAMADLFGRLKK